MDGSHTSRFFLEPQQTFQRQYEALRAIFVDDEPLDRVAERFGYKPSALRSMASRLRADCRRGVATPFFSRTAADDPSGQAPAEDRPRPETPEVADCRELNLDARPRAPLARRGRLPLPAAAWPGSASIASSPRPAIPARRWSPPPRALLSLLALKLLDKERRSHIDDFNCDEALGLFAGLNVLPKKSFATDYSYRTGRDQQLGLLQGWVKALAPVLFPERRGVLARLPSDPLPRRPRGARPPLPAAAAARPARAC